MSAEFVANMVLEVFFDGFCLSDWSADKTSERRIISGLFVTSSITFDPVYTPERRKGFPVGNPLWSGVRGCLCPEKWPQI